MCCLFDLIKFLPNVGVDYPVLNTPNAGTRDASITMFPRSNRIAGRQTRCRGDSLPFRSIKRDEDAFDCR